MFDKTFSELVTQLTWALWCPALVRMCDFLWRMRFRTRCFLHRRGVISAAAAALRNRRLAHIPVSSLHHCLQDNKGAYQRRGYDVSRDQCRVDEGSQSPHAFLNLP